MLTRVSTGEESVSAWLDQLADHTPSPGGGAAAAVLAATSAALLSMVANYTTGPKYADQRVRMTGLVDDLTALRRRAVQLADDDAAAFESVARAYKLPRSTDAEKQARSSAVQAGLQAAAEPPVAIGRLTAELVVIAAELADVGNRNVVSDVAVAALSARAALESAVVNIDINRFQIRDEQHRALLADVVEELNAAASRAAAVAAAVQAKMR